MFIAVGARVGIFVGALVADPLMDGANVGGEDAEGGKLGFLVGGKLGFLVGAFVGPGDGAFVCPGDGALVGSGVGSSEIDGPEE